MTTVFITGFPGFLGSALVERLLERYDAAVTITCLVQEKFWSLAQDRVSVMRREAQAAERIELLVGDITLPDLGLEEAVYEQLKEDIIEIYHLAAVYDLGVGRDLAMRVNVDGTLHMLWLAQACPQLKRFQYVSTCYVSGRFEGEFTESMLEEGQAFNNYYEDTKYLAEVAVQQAIKDGLPATIYRPSIVIGDSETGATQKYDGPYYIIQLILRQWRMAIVPVTGNARRYEVNVVPRNFVIDAITYLSGLEKSAGQVYHICDPNPLTVDEMLTELSKATGRRLVRVPLPKVIAKGALEYVPGVQRVMRVEPEAVEYFTQPTHYSCTNTQRDLAGSGIECPPVPTYLNRLIAFMEAHPEISSNAMV